MSTLPRFHYYLISTEGYPSLLQHLEDAMENVNRSQAFRYLVCCLDADEATVDDRIKEIQDYVTRENLRLNSCRLEIVVQNRTIESWFLGNRRIISPAGLQRPSLKKCVDYYDVRNDDPEGMGFHVDFTSHASFHLHYLQEAFLEKGLRYSKYNPGPAKEVAYLQQLETRVQQSRDHLKSFQTLLELCRRISSEVSDANE